jgi:CheY-like chemotaxis protein
VDCLETPIDPPRLRSAARKALQARDAAPAKVLHVEKDVDIRHLVSYTLRIAAETSGAASLAEARGKLEQHAYDLVVANADLPDGAGQELLPLLDRSGGRRTPLVFFNARRGEGGATHALASQLVKSLASEPDLPEPIQSWVRSGIARKPQGATT